MRIFIADDNAEFAEFCAEVARKDGWSPVLCRDGRELIQAMKREGGPALILCDLDMPHLDGTEVARELPDLNGAMRIRFMTGGSDVNALAARLIAEARDLSAGRLMLKPISVAELRKVLHFERDALNQLRS
ncbi:response regulator [Palleronia sp. LCG004]|uniref:response regulator n=1 Tax=Palleronia sp. LCG004 TaxID=3079304 RepID=UPI00294257A5|nr:response regulator [Palleronia sp. LCG004]WOI55491.1 response regulator [Palleronia sp. LCG004]